MLILKTDLQNLKYLTSIFKMDWLKKHTPIHFQTKNGLLLECRRTVNKKSHSATKNNGY